MSLNIIRWYLRFLRYTEFKNGSLQIALPLEPCFIHLHNNQMEMDGNKKASLDKLKVCVFHHLFYGDIFRRMHSKYAEFYSSCDDFDAFVSLCEHGTVLDDDLGELKDRFNRVYVEKGSFGNDWAGYLSSVNSDLSHDYDLVMLLHTKSSPHLPIGIGAQWRDLLMGCLIGCETRLQRNMKVFLQFDSVGMLASGFCRSTFLGKNASQYWELCNALDIPMTKRRIEFVAGSMCIVRADIFFQFCKKIDLFLTAVGASFVSDHTLDGEWEHAIERVFPTFVRSLGYKVVWI